MSLVKCEHCRERVRQTQLPLHLKRCIVKRRKDAVEQNKKNKPIYAKEQAEANARDLELKKAELTQEASELAEKLKALEAAEKAPEPKPKKQTRKHKGKQ